jgi:predicted dehydrogenase
MRFALLGDHPDGLDFARAVAESGRHAVAVYSGPPVGAEYLRRWGQEPRRVGDLEEVLADPTVEAIIVAGNAANRPFQLRRSLQSERHVVCVHPADQTPDTAYEAAMIQADAKQLLLPLLTEKLHPAIARLAELLRHTETERTGRFTEAVKENTAGTSSGSSSNAPQGRRLVFLEMERRASEVLLLNADVPGHKLSLPGWDVLRVLGGEIVEVSGFAAVEEVDPEAPLLVAGRFEQGGLFQATLLPNQRDPWWRLTVWTGFDRAELVFPQGWPGPALLTWHSADGATNEERWDTWNPWPALVEAFERALGRQGAPRAAAVIGAGVAGPSQHITAVPPRHVVLSESAWPLSWQDAVRSLELDDAVRRSVERRRTSTLEFQEVTEEASFKGTMTLVGCGLLWVSLLLLILSRWLPWLGWVIAPIFGLFLLLQLLRWALPKKQDSPRSFAGPSAGSKE